MPMPPLKLTDTDAEIQRYTAIPHLCALLPAVVAASTLREIAARVLLVPGGGGPWDVGGISSSQMAWPFNAFRLQLLFCLWPETACFPAKWLMAGCVLALGSSGSSERNQLKYWLTDLGEHSWPQMFGHGQAGTVFSHMCWRDNGPLMRDDSGMGLLPRESRAMALA